MKRIRHFFERITNGGNKRYCTCGHVVGFNLPFCPHCGRRMTSQDELPLD